MNKRTDAEKRKLVEQVEEKIKTTELTVKEICSSLGISDGSFYSWRKKFVEQDEKEHEPLNPLESKIVTMKREHPYYGMTKICKQLERFHGIRVKRREVERILATYGFKKTSSPKSRSKKGTRRFERNDAGNLWQTDIMYYRLKEAGRFYLISVLDDYSRYICAHKISTTQTAENVLDTMKLAVEKHGRPNQILSDRGSQFHAWRGMSKFDKTLAKMGIEHVLTSPQSPQTIGKIESWHRNLQRELLRQKEFGTIKAAREAIDEYVEYYNHERVHMGIDYVTPADRFYGVDDDIKKFMQKSSNSGRFYLTARIDGQPVRVEEDGDCLIVKLSGQTIKKVAPGKLRDFLL